MGVWKVERTDVCLDSFGESDSNCYISKALVRVKMTWWKQEEHMPTRLIRLTKSDYTHALAHSFSRHELALQDKNENIEKTDQRREDEIYKVSYHERH